MGHRTALYHAGFDDGQIDNLQTLSDLGFFALGKGRVWHVDPTATINGSGKSRHSPFNSIASAYAACVDGRGDVVLLYPGSHALAAALTWDKAHTHLIGASSPISMGQRCRVTGSAALDLASLITFAKTGCICKNVQFQNASDAAAIKAAVVVTGNYNFFENCQFGLTGASLNTSGSRAVALSGSECTFVNCVFGNDTVLRATNVMGQLSITGGAGRNAFRGCRFLSWAETAGIFLVTEASTAGGVGRWNEYEDCVFQNFWSDWIGTLDNAFDLVPIAGASTYNVVLRGACQLIGVAGWADVVTAIHTPGVNGAATYGIDTAPST